MKYYNLFKNYLSKKNYLYLIFFYNENKKMIYICTQKKF